MQSISTALIAGRGDPVFFQRGSCKFESSMQMSQGQGNGGGGRVGMGEGGKA